MLFRSAFDTLRRIELGETPLVLDRLRVQLLPDGPDGARTLHAEVAARPAVPGAVKTVSFAVNVTGPLSQLLRLGLANSDRLHVAPAR